MTRIVNSGILSQLHCFTWHEQLFYMLKTVSSTNKPRKYNFKHKLFQALVWTIKNGVFTLKYEAEFKENFTHRERNFTGRGTSI